MSSSALESMKSHAAYFDGDTTIRTLADGLDLTVCTDNVLRGNVYEQVMVWRVNGCNIDEDTAERLLEAFEE